MADGHGGYRKPTKPAAVSGPGKYAKRTDGQPGAQPVRDLPDAGYGEQAEFTGLQSAAPMAASQGMPTPSSAAGAPTGPTPLPLTAPDDRPELPVTAGVDAGEGPGSEALAPPAPSQDPEVLKLAKYLPLLQPHALSPDSSEPFRLLVRFIENAHAGNANTGAISE